jgi:hypothetical protein
MRCSRRSRIQFAEQPRNRNFIIDQLSDVLNDNVAIEDWRRVAAAVDAIIGATPQ